MMSKLYHVYVVNDLAEYFEAKLGERKDKIKIVHKDFAISDAGNLLVYYVFEAEEGLINPKWELKIEKDSSK